MKKKINKNSLINEAVVLTISTLIVKALGLIYKIPMSYILSDEGMGYFNTAYSVYTFFFILCSAGAPKAMAVLIAENSDDEERNEKIFKSGFFIFFIIGVILTFVFVLSSKMLSLIIGSQRSYLTMLAVAPSLIFISASAVIRGYFNGRLKLLPIAVSEVINGVCKLVLGLLFAHYAQDRGMELYAVSAFSILGITLGSFFGFIYLYMLYKKGMSSNGAARKRKEAIYITDLRKGISRIMKIAVPVTLTMSAGSLFNLVDMGVVMRSLRNNGFSELQANILYGNYTTLTIPMFNVVATLLAPISMILLPQLTKYNHKGEYGEINKKYQSYYSLIMFISLPTTFCFLFYSRDVLKIFFEDTSAEMAAPLLSLLSPAVILMSFTFIVNTIIEGTGNFKLPLISISVGSFIKVLISWFLTGNDNFNMISAPLGTIASYAVALLISLGFVSMNSNIKINYFKTFFLSLISSILAVFSTLKLEILLSLITNEALKSIIKICIFALFYILIYFSQTVVVLLANKYIHIRQKNPT